jgi:hypothetical protein
MRDRVVDLAAGALAFVAPAAVRDEVVGDLIEEWSSEIVPERGRAAARAWACSQVLRSLPMLVALRWQREELQPWVAALLASAVAALGAGLMADSAWRVVLAQVPLRASHSAPPAWGFGVLVVQLVVSALAAVLARRAFVLRGGKRS